MGDDARHDAYVDLAAMSGWNACADCGEWMPADRLTENSEGEMLCAKCVTIRTCLGLIEFEEKALADDDPKGKCAAHHRGAIGAYQNILRRLREGK